MKIRNGFVSNSSSSSFCILGTVLNEEWLTEEQKEEEYYDEVLENVLQGTDLVYNEGIADYYEEFIVGKSVLGLNENATIVEQKKEIAEKIQKVFNLKEPPKVSFHTDGGYEG